MSSDYGSEKKEVPKAAVYLDLSPNSGWNHSQFKQLVYSSKPGDDNFVVYFTYGANISACWREDATRKNSWKFIEVASHSLLLRLKTEIGQSWHQ